MRCPVCRAENDTGPYCRRCRADLSLLFTLEAQREHYLKLAYRYAAQGQWQQAYAIGGSVDRLRRDKDSQRLLAISSLMRGDFLGAWQYYQQSAKENSEESR